MIITDEMFDLAVEAESGLSGRFTDKANDAALKLCRLIIREYAVIPKENPIVTHIEEVGETEPKLV